MSRTEITVAVEGCCHGELDSIYASIALTEQRSGAKVDLLLVCGDFQAVRNAADLAGMACPAKYRAMQTFYKYYSGLPQHVAHACAGIAPHRRTILNVFVCVRVCTCVSMCRREGCTDLDHICRWQP